MSNKTVDSVERKKPPIQTITSDEESDTEYDSETGKHPYLKSSKVFFVCVFRFWRLLNR